MPLMAIPNAYGPGMDTRHAYGGGMAPEIMIVDTIANSGAGSLRWALEAPWPRIILPYTSGRIVLQGPVNATNPYLWLAGQAAPFPGLYVSGGGADACVEMRTHDFLIEHIFNQAGPDMLGNFNYSGFGSWYYDGNPSHHGVFANMDVCWGQDENIYWNGHDFTLWRCLIYEGLNQMPGSGTGEGGGLSNGHGLLVSNNASDRPFGQHGIIQSIFAHCMERNPYPSQYSGTIIANNVIYNAHEGPFFADVAALGRGNSGPLYAAVVHNYIKKGPATSFAFPDFAMGCRYLRPGCEIYEAGNIIDNAGGTGPDLIPFAVLDSDVAGWPSIDPRVSAWPSYAPYASSLMSAADAYEFVLANAGCRPSNRSVSAARIISEIRNRTGSVISSPSEREGYLPISVNARTLTLPLDPHGVRSDGYTNLENFLNDMRVNSGGGEVPSSTIIVSPLIGPGLALTPGPVTVTLANPPTNIDATNAAVIPSLPYEATQDVNDAGVTKTVWFKYTAVTGDNEIGLFGFGDLTAYEARVEVFGPDSSVDDYLAIDSSNSWDGSNAPIQMPVEPGKTYYFKISNNSGNVTPAVLTVRAYRHVDEAVRPGDIAIHDDTVGFVLGESVNFPLAIIDPVDGHVRRFIPNIAASEVGAMLTSGKVLIRDDTNTLGVSGKGFRLYSDQFVLLASVETYALRIGSNKVDTFYVGGMSSGTEAVRAVSDAGVLGASWAVTPAGIMSLEPSNDDTILYYTVSDGLKKIRRWDLVNDVALSDLAADLGGGYHPGQDILVLADDSIIVGYEKSGSDYLVKRYSAAGAVLNTYNMGPSDTGGNRLTYGSTDTTFVVWNHFLETGLSSFTEVSTVSGIGTPVEAQEFTRGVFTGEPTATPPEFGFSNSCTLFTMRSAIPAPPQALIGTSSPILTTSPPTQLVDSNPCCAPTASPMTGSVTGPVIPPPDPAWTPFCEGGGMIPVADDIIESENWRI